MEKVVVITFVAAVTTAIYMLTSCPLSQPRLGTMVGKRHAVVEDKGNAVVVLIHGVGGQLAQFEAVWTDDNFKFSVLALDMPGHGFSEASQDQKDYSIDAFVQQVLEILEPMFDRKVVLVGHSYGAQIAIKASKLIPKEKVVAVILVCPRAEFTESDLKGSRTLVALPTPILDILRWFDKLGGTNSVSVTRMLSSKASLEMRQKQLQFNLATPTDVVRMTVKGIGEFGKVDYQNLPAPLFIINGELDMVCPNAKNTTRILEFLPLPADHVRTLPVGHNPMLEAPTEFVATLTSFITAALS